MSKIAFLFPGQGAQTVGMGRELYDGCAAARALFERADELLGYSLSKLCFEGPQEQLDATENSQPALYVTSMAALEFFKQESPEIVTQCGAAAGLSLGEYTATAFADGFDFEQGLHLVRQRGLAMQAAADLVPSGMVSVLGLDRQQVQELCDQSRQESELLQIANLLCPGNIAISGHRQSCGVAAANAEKMGAMRAIPLAVAGAFHTAIMEPAVEHLSTALAQADIRPPRIPVISNVDAQAHGDPNQIREVLQRQVCSTVLWEDSMRRLLGDGYDVFYEVGTGRVLRGLMKRIDRRVVCEGVS